MNVEEGKGEIQVEFSWFVLHFVFRHNLYFFILFTFMIFNGKSEKLCQRTKDSVLDWNSTSDAVESILRMS